MVYEEKFRSILIMCVEYYKQHEGDRIKSGGVYDGLTSRLKDVMGSAARFHKAFFTDWKEDTNYPGYLIKIEPPVAARVPYHLLPVFPDRDTLKSVWSISRKIKTNDKSVICLSGSTAMQKSMTYIGDLDFCDYVRLEDIDVARDFGKKLQSDVAPVCTNFQFDDVSWKLPKAKNQDQILRKLENMNPKSRNRSRFKIDMLSEIENYRILQATNVGIVCDSYWESAATQKTFAAQEAGLTTGDILPNPLTDPFETGRYISWLRAEIEKLLAEKPIKASKRMLSLARFCFMTKQADRIKELLDTNYDVIMSEINEITQILDIISDENSDVASEYKNRLLKAKQERLTLADKVAETATPRDFSKSLNDVKVSMFQTLEPEH
jgi:hypothetical protein